MCKVQPYKYLYGCTLHIISRLLNFLTDRFNFIFFSVFINHREVFLPVFHHFSLKKRCFLHLFSVKALIFC